MSTGYAPLGGDSGPCERDGCDEPSAYVLPTGERCDEHAREECPEHVAVLDALAGRGDQ